MKEGVENNVVTQEEREATMRTLGHSASTVNRYYLPNDRYKLDYDICVVILINLWFHNRLNDARKATAALERVYQSGQEEEEEGHFMSTESETAMESEEDGEEEEGEEEEHIMESEEEGDEEEEKEEEEDIMNTESESEEEETAMESEEDGEEEEGEEEDHIMESEEEGDEEEEEDAENEAQGGSMKGVEEECEWQEEEEKEQEVATPPLQPIWGKLHPDKRSPTDGVDIRVLWSEAERGYVLKWIVDKPDVPVRLLYEDVHACNVARDIFHSHHVELDKISYMFKLIRKTVL